MPDAPTAAQAWPGLRPTPTGTFLAPERRAVTRPASSAPTGVAPRPVPELPVPDEHPADPSRVTSAAPAAPASSGVDVALEIEGGATTLFEAGIDAFHADDYARAESLFLEEAARAIDTAPQRAAIAYRQAALAAERGGNHDGADHWMRLAGREYLRVSEDVHTPLPFIREAALMAAKCFLNVDNVNVASKGLRRAQAIESVLAADDDLTASGTAIPFRHETAFPARHPAPAVDVEPATRGRLARLRHLIPGRRAA